MPQVKKGRPPAKEEEKRTHRVALHFSDAELEVFTTDARVRGYPLAALIRQHALNSARSSGGGDSTST